MTSHDEEDEEDEEEEDVSDNDGRDDDPGLAPPPVDLCPRPGFNKSCSFFENVHIKSPACHVAPRAPKKPSHQRPSKTSAKVYIYIHPHFIHHRSRTWCRRHNFGVGRGRCVFFFCHLRDHHSGQDRGQEIDPPLCTMCVCRVIQCRFFWPLFFFGSLRIALCFMILRLCMHLSPNWCPTQTGMPNWGYEITCFHFGKSWCKPNFYRNFNKGPECARNGGPKKQKSN